MWEKAEKGLTKDKYIGPLIKKYGPCRLKPSFKTKYFEDLVDSIISQQLSVKAASTIHARLKKKAKGKITPEAILRLRNETIRACGLSNAKVAYVKDLARRVRDKEVEIHKMDKLKDEKILEELIVVKGIGKWTAEMFLMFSLVRPDIFPVDDLGIKNAMKKLLKKDMTSNEMVNFAKRWAPYRSVASWYLWKVLDNQ